MNDDLIKRVKVMLRLRKAGNLSQWNAQTDASMSEEYSLVLAPVPDYVGRWLLREIPLRWPWRPEPSELEAAIVARFAVKHPAAKDSYAKLAGLREVIGPFGQPRRDNPCFFEEGPPPLLSDIEAEMIADRGGWVEFCHSKTPHAIEKSQYLKEYDGVLARAASEGRQTYFIPAMETAPPPPMLPPMLPGNRAAPRQLAGTQRQLTNTLTERNPVDSEN